MTLKELYDYCVKNNIPLDSELVFGWDGYFPVDGFSFAVKNPNYGYYKSNSKKNKYPMIFVDLDDINTQELDKYKPVDIIILNNKYAKHFP